MYVTRVGFGTIWVTLLLFLAPVSGCGDSFDPGWKPPDGGDPADAPAGASDGGSDDSDAGSDAPDAGSDDPDAGSDDPDAGSDDPDAGSDDPDAGSDDPDAGSDDPDAGSDDPDAGSDDPDAGSDDPDAGSDDPDAGSDGLPDLRVSAERLEDTWMIEWRYFSEESCAWVEHCLGGTGWRLLLRFATEIQNVGTADLELGAPEANEDFDWAGCHGHYHLRSSTHQELLDSEGTPVAEGLKQGFCWTDNVEVPDFPSQPRKYAFHGEDSCNVVQGLTVGWADVYLETLDCQWIDITDVDPGPYTLRVYANPAGLIEELDYSNNIAEIPVEVTRPTRE